MHIEQLALLDFLSSALTTTAFLFQWRAVLFAIAGIGFFVIARTAMRSQHLTTTTRITALVMGCFISSVLMLYAWLS